MIAGKGIAEALEHPEDYIESRDYFSWERYFTSLLIRNTEDNYLRYAKRQLNPVYMQERISDMVLAVMKGIDLK